ncbi:MAG: hypothetical protein QOG88_1595, partial [Actinomycetota bacterium]|nr:hypothetical protein [Actinomycetota bacterium]
MAAIVDGRVVRVNRWENANGAPKGPRSTVREMRLDSEVHVSAGHAT